MKTFHVLKHNMKNCSSVYELYLLDIPQAKETTSKENPYLKVHNVASIIIYQHH